MAYTMHDVKTIHLDLSAISDEVPLVTLVGTMVATGLVDEYEREVDELVKAGKVELGVGGSVVGVEDISGTTDGEVDEATVCGGAELSSDEDGIADGMDAEIELAGDESNDLLTIFVIVNAGLEFPELPYTRGVSVMAVRSRADEEDAQTMR